MSMAVLAKPNFGDDILEGGANQNGNYVRFDNGLIIQWNDSATLPPGPGFTRVTFPINFVSTMPAVTANVRQFVSPAFVNVVNTSLSDFSANIWGLVGNGGISQPGGLFNWVAIGY